MQRGEFANSITSVGKDSMVILIDDMYKNRDVRIYKDYAPSLRSEREGLKIMQYDDEIMQTALTRCPKDSTVVDIDGEMYRIRIRKLTPKECFRLMGFTDEQFERAAQVNSASQLYKQAGNSIVVDTLCYIFSALMDAEYKINYDGRWNIR